MRRLLLWAAVLLLLPVSPAQEAEPVLRLAEVVAAPQTDWNDDGRVTASDEFVEVANLGTLPVDLTGWRLRLNDTTPEVQILEGTLAPGARRAFVNPPGELNNNAHVALLDDRGRVADEIRYGSWPGATILSAASTGPNDEALRLVGASWSRGHATPDAPPTGPTVRTVAPFPVGPGHVSFDTGNRSYSWRITWADSDRSYPEARLQVRGDHTDRSWVGAATYLAGRGQAEVNLLTPSEDFLWQWSVVDATGAAWPGPAGRVRIDRAPPSAPLLDVPPWTNATSLAVHARSVEDEGVGGVEYALEQVEEGISTRLYDWSDQPDLGTVTWGNRSLLILRGLARDALGNVATGPVHEVRLDRSPPAAPAVTSQGAYDRIRLTWTATADSGSGVQTFVVHRNSPTAREWRLPANVTSFEDASFRPGDALTYEVWAIDGAGNRGNASRVNVSYEGERTHMRGLRFSKTIWGAGTMRIHADFDRAMDATQDAELRVDGERVWGRWLANHTTYLAELDAYEGPDGNVTIRLVHARDAKGRTLWAPAERRMPTDGAAPSLVASDHDGWVNATGLRLEAVDGGRPALVRYRLGNATEWTDAEGNVTLSIREPTRVRTQAVDEAGWRSREMDRTIRSDLEGPVLGEPRLAKSGLRIPIQDPGSGVNPSSIRVTDDRGRVLDARFAEDELSVDLGDAGAILLEARDEVGNAASARWAKPSPADVVAAQEQPDGALAGSRSDAFEPRPKTHAGYPVHAVKAGGIGLIAAALVLGTVKAGRRRRPPRPSLARRVRRLRASQRLF